MNCHDHNIASHVEFFPLVMQSSPTSGRKCDEPLRTSAWEAGSQYCLIQNWVLYLHYFIFYGYQYQRKEEKWHMYILTYINLPLWSWWQLNLFPERKKGPLSLKSFLKLKASFSAKKKRCSKHDPPHDTHCYNVAGQGTTQWYCRRRGRSKKIENQKDLMQIK